MNKLEKTLNAKYNELLKLKIYVSWRQFLETSYEIASDKKQYNTCHEIQLLISEDINS
jgi:hypothetical protein